MGDNLYSIVCSCIFKFVLIQHIISTQVSDTGQMVLWFIDIFDWFTDDKLPLLFLIYTSFPMKDSLRASELTAGYLRKYDVFCPNIGYIRK